MVQDRSTHDPKTGKKTGSVALSGKVVPTAQRGLPLGVEASMNGDQINATWLKYNRMPHTWTEYNERVFGKLRAIAVRDEHGNYHPECADGRNISLESWNPNSPSPVSIILPIDASNIAKAQGLTCTHCGEYIILPTLTSGLSDAEIEFRRVNDAYLSGLVSRGEWVLAVRAWAISLENPESAASPGQVESQLESVPLSESEQLDSFKKSLTALVSEYEEYGLDEGGSGDQFAIDLGLLASQTISVNDSVKLQEFSREVLNATDRYESDKQEDMHGESNLADRIRYIIRSI
jgi:hypothetical protein